MTAISIQGLVKHYGDVRALGGIDLAVEEGEIFGFLGPNGAGKSTTIDIMLDFVRPTAGTATVLGLDAQRESLDIRRRVGVLPDGYHLYDRLTARQHLEFAGRSKGVDVDTEDLLERVGIADAIDRRAGGFSKGMTQRLALAIALVGEPDLLILDEPSAGLDPNGAREIRKIVREERERGATVFFSSHILGQVEAVCDRVAILDAGQVVAVDTIQGLREANQADATLVVQTDREPEDGLAAVRAMSAVSSVSVAGPEITIECAEEAKWAVLSAIDEGGLTIRDFYSEPVSLEALFAAYTTHSSDATETPDADEAMEVEA